MALKEYELDQRHRAKAARNRDATGQTKVICECGDLRCNAILASTTRSEAAVRTGFGFTRVTR